MSFDLVVGNLSSEDNDTKNISTILYYCDDAEQDSIVNGLYGYVINSEQKKLLKRCFHPYYFLPIDTCNEKRYTDFI